MVEIDKQAIREYMMKAAINVKDLADKSNVSPATVQKLVNRGGKVNFKTVGLVAKSLDVTPQELIKAYV